MTDDKTPEDGGAGRAAHPETLVVVLADDLIWATRLVDAVRAAGATPIRARRLEELSTLVTHPADRVVVDLTARAYDGVQAVDTAVANGARVIAVGQHDDRELRRAARDAGAERVYTYRVLFEDGPRRLAAWLAR